MKKTEIIRSTIFLHKNISPIENKHKIKKKKGGGI